jgi:hypothetical protein
MRPEFKGRKGVNEVSSYLDFYVRNILPDNVRQLHLFSDACPGQNLNHTVMHYLYSTVSLGKFDKITHHLPIRGHSCLPCDRIFGIIGHMEKKHERVEKYTDWEKIIKEKSDVITMNGSLF